MNDRRRKSCLCHGISRFFGNRCGIVFALPVKWASGISAGGKLRGLWVAGLAFFAGTCGDFFQHMGGRKEN